MQKIDKYLQENVSATDDLRKNMLKLILTPGSLRGGIPKSRILDECWREERGEEEMAILLNLSGIYAVGASLERRRSDQF